MKTAVVPKLPGVFTASSLVKQNAEEKWSYGVIVGRFVELSSGHASALLTVAMNVVVEAQRKNEPTAWITTEDSEFYPPDAVAHGVDVDALVVVRVPQAENVTVSADKLLRSGGFGLLVLDLGMNTDVPMPLQSRLTRLAQKHHSAVVCLTQKSAKKPSLGSLVSLRGEACRTSIRDGLYECAVHVLKDKHHSALWMHRERYGGPMGMC